MYTGTGTDFDWALARYNVDGSLDTTFGAGGKVITVFGAGEDVANAAAIDASGDIVVAGYAHNGTDFDFALARYSSDGSLDTGFGTGGLVTTDFSVSTDVATAISIRGDGKILVGGSAWIGSGYDLALVRYNADGSLDATFGTQGKVTTDFGLGFDLATARALRPDGKIVVAGYAYNGTDYDFALARYQVDGTLDTAFGAGGKVTTDFGFGNDRAYAIALAPDGTMVVAGEAYSGTDSDVAVARYNPDGSLDETFHSDGRVTTDFGFGGDAAWAVGVRADGRIVAVGEAHNGVDGDIAVARYNADGTLDAEFDSDGKAVHDFGKGNDAARAMRLLEDGGMVVAGHADNGGDLDFAVQRYHADGAALTATVTGLANGTAYTFTVTSTNAAGSSSQSAPSNQVVPQGPPGPPTSVTALAGDREATVAWSEPASDGGSPIAQYTVTSDPDGLSVTVDGSTSTSTSTSSSTVTGLTNGTGCTFTVRAINAIGTGDPSEPSNEVNPRADPTPTPTLTPTPVAVPTLSQWALIALAGVWAVTVGWRFRRDTADQ